MNNTNNTEIAEKINELSEITPDDDYKTQTDDEDPDALERARKKLMLMVNTKCKGIGPGIIQGQIKPMIYKMNVADCETMTELIKKKGMYGLPLMLKTTTKHIG